MARRVDERDVTDEVRGATAVGALASWGAVRWNIRRSVRAVAPRLGAKRVVALKYLDVGVPELDGHVGFDLLAMFAGGLT